jgi:hypothetical protein
MSEPTLPQVSGVPEWGSTPDSSPTIRQRRESLELFVIDRSALAELDRPDEPALPFALQAIAAELCSVSVAQMELEEFKDVTEMALALLGGLCPVQNPFDAEYSDGIERNDRGEATSEGMKQLMRAIGTHQAQRLDPLEALVEQLVAK